jgi:hypothetical protein
MELTARKSRSTHIISDEVLAAQAQPKGTWRRGETSSFMLKLVFSLAERAAPNYKGEVPA